MHCISVTVVKTLLSWDGTIKAKLASDPSPSPTPSSISTHAQRRKRKHGGGRKKSDEKADDCDLYAQLLAGKPVQRNVRQEKALQDMKTGN